MNRTAPLLVAALLFVGPAAGFAQSAAPAANVEATPPGEAPADPNDTEILDMRETTFAAKDRIAVFNGDVRVKDPRFTLACDKLTVYLNKNATASATPGAAATPPPVAATPKAAGEKSGEPERGSGIDHALAEGQVIIIQKRAPAKAGEEEKVTIARADRAEYDNKTGDMTLRGMPKVEQNGDSHEAISSSTYMVLHRDNSLETHGPSRTYIVQRGKDSLPGGNPTGSPAKGHRTPAGGTTN